MTKKKPPRGTMGIASESPNVTSRSSERYVTGNVKRSSIAQWRLLFVTLLEIENHSAAIHELVDRIESQGHHLGKYPGRTLKTCIGHATISSLFVTRSGGTGDVMDDTISIAPGRGIRDLL